MREWYGRNSVTGTLSFILACSNIEVVGLLHSKIFGSRTEGDRFFGASASSFSRTARTLCPRTRGFGRIIVSRSFTRKAFVYMYMLFVWSCLRHATVWRWYTQLVACFKERRFMACAFFWRFDWTCSLVLTVFDEHQNTNSKIFALFRHLSPRVGTHENVWFVHVDFVFEKLIREWLQY